MAGVTAMTRHYETYTAARAGLRQLLDTARSGKVTTLRRDGESFTVVQSERLRDALARMLPSRPVVAADGSSWAAYIPGVPVAGDGHSVDDAVADLIDALRDYATDWNDRLLTAPNHRDNWALVELVELSSDDQLAAWALDRPGA